MKKSRSLKLELTKALFEGINNSCKSVGMICYILNMPLKMLYKKTVPYENRGTYLWDINLKVANLY